MTRFVRHPDAENLPVLVHCEHGVVRTGMLVAVYQMERLGQSNQRAIESLPMFGHDLFVPRRKPMRDFILGYEPRAERLERPERRDAPVAQKLRP